MKNSSNINVLVGENSVNSTCHVKNLGAVFDCYLNMDKFIDLKCKTIVYYIRSISKIRKYLTREATESLVNAYITSRLDYCNSLLYGLPKSQIFRLQKLQNMAARLVCVKSKWQHITPSLIELHWLPVNMRIIFKILVYVFKALNGLSPHYLSNSLIRYEPERNLRSSQQFLLKENRTYSKYGIRAFSNNAPTLWNGLPISIRSATSIIVFKKLLKTHLFKCGYSL